MTENKRFYVAESKLIDGYCVFDREKKYAFSPKPREADCLNDAHTLNELYEENEQLQQKIKREIQHNQRLHSDNVELHEEKQHLQRRCGAMQEEIEILSEEKEQLKQAYNDAKKDVEKKEQILKDIMKDNLLIQDIEKELEE